MMKSYHIDINCDLGEGLGNESDLLPYISSCNIACGGHAGDENLMRTVASEASKYGVKVGAHPAYPDRENFGRVSMTIPREELSESIQSQLKSMTAILKTLRVPLNHIKPHGALYNDIAADASLAEAFLESISAYKPDVLLYLPFRSRASEIAIKKGFRVFFEAFADRNYNEDLSLVSRKLQNAIIESPKAVLRHLINMIHKKAVVTITGKKVEIEADTFCVHGDTPSALQILMYLSKELPKHQIEIKK